MKRQIKFRAWHYEEGNPMYKAYMDYSDDDLALFFERVQNEYCSVKVTQYTGLKDKNGKEIYEGDVFESKESNPLCGSWQAVWNNYMWALKDLTIKGSRVILPFGLNVESLEIIGNIYENPELLEPTEEELHKLKTGRQHD